MTEYFTFNTAISLQGVSGAWQWFLPNEQYTIVGQINTTLVNHRTRSGWPLPSETVNSLHYIIDRDGDQFTVPKDAGVILDFEIPQEFINRYLYEEQLYSDNITDYIKAAAEYLNIEIRFRPETSRWYRERFEQGRIKGPEQVGADYDQETGKSG